MEGVRTTSQIMCDLTSGSLATLKKEFISAFYRPHSGDHEVTVMREKRSRVHSHCFQNCRIVRTHFYMLSGPPPPFLHVIRNRNV